MNFALKFKLNKYFAMYIVGTFILFKTNKNYLKRFNEDIKMNVIMKFQIEFERGYRIQPKIKEGLLVTLKNIERLVSIRNFI